MTESENNYLGYYLNNNNYVYSYLHATDIEINRIPRLGSVIGYAQALNDMSGLDNEKYIIIDYIHSCLDDNNKFIVVMRTEYANSIPSSFFKILTEAWVKMTQGTEDQVHFQFNNE